MSLEIVLLDSAAYKDWDDFANRSDDAWFWHTTHWMAYAQEYVRDRFLTNRSFLLVEDSKLLAICPVFVERSISPAGAIQYSLAGAPLPFPAMRNDLRNDKRERVLAKYIKGLDVLARDERIGYVWVRIPSVSKSSMVQQEAWTNPLLKYGFIDLPYQTQVIDLRKDKEALWGEIRKGHKSDIKRGEQACRVTVWDNRTVTPEKFDEYRVLHQKDAGRVTRSKRTFDLMLSWVREGHAILVEASNDTTAVGFSLVIIFESGAYYGSSCRDPDYPELPVGHLIQWATICWLRDHGFTWYDIGIQQFGPQWFDQAGPKDFSISKFKRGFGGRTIPLVTGERFYSKSFLEQTMKARWRAYTAALFQDRVESSTEDRSDGVESDEDAKTELQRSRRPDRTR